MKNVIIFQDNLVFLFKCFFIEIHIAVLLLFILIATAYDMKSRRIPNSVVFPGSIIGIAYHAISPYGSGMLYSLEGFAVGLIAFMLLYILRAMGAGDVKMMAMVGAFLGPSSAFGAVLTTLLAGGILAITAALWNKSLYRVLANVRFIMLDTLVSTMNRTGCRTDLSSISTAKIPYAVPIAAGTVVHLLLVRAGLALVS